MSRWRPPGISESRAHIIEISKLTNNLIRETYLQLVAMRKNGVYNAAGSTNL